jgi:hypothetical protein
VEGVRSVRLAKFQVSLERFGRQGRPGLVCAAAVLWGLTGKAFDLRALQDRGREKSGSPDAGSHEPHPTRW